MPPARPWWLPPSARALAAGSVGHAGSLGHVALHGQFALQVGGVVVGRHAAGFQLGIAQHRLDTGVMHHGTDGLLQLQDAVAGRTAGGEQPEQADQLPVAEAQLLHGRHLRQQQRAPAAGVAEGTQLAFLHQLLHRRDGRKRQIHIAREDLRDGRAGALQHHQQQFRAGVFLELLGGQVGDVAEAGDGAGQSARLGPCQLGQLRHVACGQVGAAHQHHAGAVGHQRHWRHVLHRVEGQLLRIEGDVADEGAGGEQHLVAIRPCRRHLLRRHDAVGAGLVLEHHGLAENAAQPVGDRPAEDVQGATWGEGHHHAQRTRRKHLSLRPHRWRGQGRSDSEQAPAVDPHGDISPERHCCGRGRSVLSLLSNECFIRMTESQAKLAPTLAESPARTVERILSAAARLFAERGMAGVGLREITAEAGVNLAAVNYHFGSKEKLLEALFARRALPITQERMRLLGRCAEAPGRQPMLEQVLEGFLRPAFSLGREAGVDGATFGKLRARLSVESVELYRRILSQAFDASTAAFLEAVVAALPDLPRAEVEWRFPYFIQELHINREHDFKHMVIYGPPGTGKTQIANLVGRMYSKLGILKNGTFKKVTRTDLVAGYLGQTSIKTAKVIQDSLGGCLFIDEVYSLGTGGNVSTENGGGESGGDSFSKECIDTLCEALSNYKEDLMVIIAGYEKDINESFFKMNQGLPSRFIWRFHVDEYTHDELMQIFIQKVKHNGWFINEDQDQYRSLQQWFVTNHKHFPYFGRDMELLFTYTKISHGRRIFGKPPELRKHLTQEDLDNGLKIYMKNANNKDNENKHKLSESCLGMYL